MTEQTPPTQTESDHQARFGQVVRKCRRGLGITQEELAWRANMHRSYIADIERGGRNITLRSIAKLAWALQVSVSSLMHSLDASAAQAVDEGGSQSGRELREILLVEDNPEDVELTVRAFKRANFSNPVSVARDGQEALDRLFQPANRPAHPGFVLPLLILLGLKLPRLSGLEVLRRLKQDKRTRKIPVVVLTISQHDQEMVECARLGAEDCIIRPVSLERLCRVISRLNLHWELTPAGIAARKNQPA